MTPPAIDTQWSVTPQTDFLDKYQCAHCQRSFKRPEHLRRHQRSHDGQKRFVCSTCSKGFARSDILHRHESTHNAMASSSTNHRKRACTECAKARERCTKTDTCSRCSIRLLQCSYPGEHLETSLNELLELDDCPASVTGRKSHIQKIPQRPNESNLDPGELGTVITSLTQNEDAPSSEMISEPRSSGTEHAADLGSMTGGAIRRSDNTSQSLNAMEIVTSLQTPSLAQVEYGPNAYIRADTTDPILVQPNGFETTIDFPMNWLPANESIDIDYNSILGLGISSSGFFRDSSQVIPETMRFNYLNDVGLPGFLEPQQQQLADQQPCQYVQNPATNNQGNSPKSTSASSPGETISSTSINSTDPVSPKSAPGGLYATSKDGARVPCTVRSRRAHPLINGATPITSIINEKNDLNNDRILPGFPDLVCISPENIEDSASIKELSALTYEIIAQHFAKLCLNQNSVYPAYSNGQFPTLNHFNLFVRLYFEHFHSIIPIMHTETTDLDGYWLLALAVSAIGCQYTNTEEFSQCVGSFHEFLRRALAVEVEASDWEGQCNLPLMQAMVLSQIGMLYSGSNRLSSLARSRHSSMIELVQSCALLQHRRSPATNLIDNHNSKEARWKLWVAEETKRRIGYTIWLLDCMSAYHFTRQPRLSLDAAQCELPHDRLWISNNALEWASLFKSYEKNPSLSTAVSTLFLEKEVKSDMGEFSRILLLHGIYQEIFKVKSYLSRPLSAWTPSVQTPARPVSESRLPNSADGAATVSSWRNAGLDSVDVLHWAANATIAQLAGSEHPTVLHLHVSRVVLLTPYEKIQTLALSIASLTQDTRLPRGIPGIDEAISAEQEVLQWVQQDEHKARLAVLHCGCVYWHVRRYSCKAFYEPISVFLATLTLWAYSSYASRAKLRNRHLIVNDDDGSRSGSATRQSSFEALSNRLDGAETSIVMTNQYGQDFLVGQSPAPSDFENDPEPTFIRLDRPNDDEMVQLFVRSGRPSAMRAHITGVGDICSPKGPSRILKEGRKILGAVSSAWGRTKEYISILEAIEKVTINNTGSAR